MSQAADGPRSAPLERQALAAFCSEVGALRAEFSREPEHKRRLLARIEAEAAARRPIHGLLGELLGTEAGGTTRALSTALPGSGAGRADEERFGCPDRACDRVCEPLPAGPVPHCEITGEPMRRR